MDDEPSIIEQNLGIEDLLSVLENKLAQNSTPEYNPQEHNDKTRSTIALYFVKGFFWITGAVLLLVPIYNIFVYYKGGELLSLRDILLSISGTISGPLGFVIGHYFKSDKN